MTPAYSLLLEELLARPTAPMELAEPLPLSGIPTPALLLDEAALQRNIARMAAFLEDRGKGVRPHAKTHKCPEVAKRQLQAGAVGVCAAKVSEAAALIGGGIGDVLITSPVMSAEKAALIAELAGRARLDVVVDNPAGLELLAAAMPEGSSLGVLIDLDVEMGRTGTRSDEVMLALAERISAVSTLSFRGVQHYAGHLMHVAGYSERRDRSLALWEKVAARIRRLEDAGFACAVVTGAGTGTFDIDCDVECLTDLQVGSYVFMDQEYREIGGRDGGLFEEFEVALTVLTTAISQPLGKAVTVDGGFKVFASDTVNPEPLDLAGARYRFGGDEHGIVLLAEGSQQPTLGTLARFITPHCDPTVNLHDAYWVCENDTVHARWPITGRGCSW